MCIYICSELISYLSFKFRWLNRSVKWILLGGAEFDASTAAKLKSKYRIKFTTLYRMFGLSGANWDVVIIMLNYIFRMSYSHQDSVIFTEANLSYVLSVNL